MRTPFRDALAHAAPFPPSRAQGADRISCALPSLSTSAAAWITRLLHQQAEDTVTVLVADGPRTLESLYQDLHTLGDALEHDLLYFPPWEQHPGIDLAGSAQDLQGDRLQTLLLAAQRPYRIIATTIQALLQKVPDPTRFLQRSRNLTVGLVVNPDALANELQELGYRFEPEVLDKGEASRRGGLLDLWPPNAPSPLRIEFFGDEIDSIRSFEPSTQRSITKLEQVSLAPAVEGGIDEAVTTLCAYLPANTQWVWFEPELIRRHAELYAELLREQEQEHLALDWATFAAVQQGHAKGGNLDIGPNPGVERQRVEAPMQPLPAQQDAPAAGLGTELLEVSRQAFLNELADRAGAGASLIFTFNTEGARARFLEMSGERWKPYPRVHILTGMLAEGFQVPGQALVLVAESDLFGLRKRVRNKYDLHARTRQGSAPAGARFGSWTDIEPGEFVVHLDHGIGRYLGLYEIETAGQRQEVLSIAYADGAKLHIPVGQAHLLSRYVGLGNAQPDLHTLGGTGWTREKITAEKAVRDLAAQMLETQAQRQALPGHAFAPDTPWQHEFESTFPYQETVDQERTLAAVKQDMESPKPMDRLICGDVGYGKTEIAMRAAFKAVMDGRQVAVLVPTTVLAQQHFLSFTERMASFPVRISVLSRFRTKAEQTETVKQLRRGEIDIVIGTHRLASRDVGFKNLGLVIIDEEQRFGVRHKEKLKQMRAMVDVLTLSATPIPRTLYLSMTGARDISTIQTPPRERLPVETRVELFAPPVIRSAILRELNREGQVFYLHNRVQTIHSTERLLKELVPEARIAVGHGQMPERRLEDVVNRFSQGEYDVLLCTTIIESGIDMPNVNTILIDRADRFGLAELYQLRGRVGRYKHQAYAYLLLPPEGGMRAAARERLRALQRYSDMGSGFKIAMRDLEIRGAGNLLGSQQSGHIASVGFELYCQLLDQSIRALKKQPPRPLIDVKIRLDFLDASPQATDSARACTLPKRYIEDEAHRVELYRRFASLSTSDEVEALHQDVSDRFGRPPAPVRRLFALARLRLAAHALQVKEVDVRENKVMLSRHGDYLMRGSKFPRLYQRTPDERLHELTHLLEHWNDE